LVLYRKKEFESHRPFFPFHFTINLVAVNKYTQTRRSMHNIFGGMFTQYLTLKEGIAPVKGLKVYTILSFF